MADFPALPIWTDAYLADCSHLSDAEHGIYLRLLMLMWRSPQCRIPNDDEWIARKLSRDANAVRTHVRPLINEFCECTEWITQKRLLKEWEWCTEKRKKNSTSAKSRWNNKNTSCERNANAMPDTQSERNAPTPFPIKEIDTIVSKKKIPVEQVTTDMVKQWAIEHIPDTISIDRELLKFQNHEWKKKVPKDGVKAFCNWLLTAVDIQNRDNPPELAWHLRPENRMPSPAGG